MTSTAHSAESYGWAELVGLDRDQLVTMSKQRAVEQGLTTSPSDARNVINMLRHDYTTYDFQIRRTDRLYGELLDAIARDFPWLAEQCERDKATHFARLPHHIKYRRNRWDDAVARQSTARAAIKSLAVGDRVIVSWHGPREATVTEVRRTRIKAQFPLPDGTIYVIDRPADQVSKVEKWNVRRL